MLNPIRIAGPIFEFELLTTARRGRYYAVRAAYASVLLLAIWQIYVSWTIEYGHNLTPALASRFALTIFSAIVIGQEIVVLALTPAMVSGVIASERQRKTLHYLMASSLGSFEIVFGKLMARMLHIAVFLGVGFPISSLLVLIGGIDPRLVLLSIGWTGATAFFLCAVSVFVSVHSKTTREALFLAYAVEGLWLIAPFVVAQMVGRLLPDLYDWIEPVNGLVLDSNPFSLIYFRLFPGLPLTGFLEDMTKMMMLQFVAGVFLAVVSALRLRPVFRNQSDAPTNRRSLGKLLLSKGSNRWIRRPSCGDAPMVWKEAFTSRQTRLMRFVGLLLTLAIALPVLYVTVTLGGKALLEQFNYLEEAPNLWMRNQYRIQFGYFVRESVPFLFLFAMIGTAASAAASVTSEHEGDTWTNLTATDLTPREIVLAKLFGSLRSGLKVVVPTTLLTGFGVLTGSLHPLALLLYPFEAMVFLLFAASFGVRLSTALQSTWRAQFLTISLLFLVSLAGQTLVNIFVEYRPMLWPGFYPAEISRSLLAADAIESLRAQQLSWSDLRWSQFGQNTAWSIVYSVTAIAIYMASAFALTFDAFRAFDVAAGRPKRPRTKAALPADNVGDFLTSKC